MPLPDERPRASVANLIGRFEQTKRTPSSSTSPTIIPRSLSVSSHITGDSAKEETKEKREWPPKSTNEWPPKTEGPIATAPPSSWSRAQTVLQSPPAPAPQNGQLPPTSSNRSPDTAKPAPPNVLPGPDASSKTLSPPAKSTPSKTKPPTATSKALTAATGTSAKAPSKAQTTTKAPPVKTQPLKAQHTGQSITSTSARKSAVPPTTTATSTPEKKITPSRTKTSSAAPPSTTPAKTPPSTVHAKALSSAPKPSTTRPKMSTGLFAPTAASLAKARNAEPALPTPLRKPTISSQSFTERMGKPTAASASKAKEPVTTSNRPSTRGGSRGRGTLKSKTAGARDPGAAKTSTAAVAVATGGSAVTSENVEVVAPMEDDRPPHEETEKSIALESRDVNESGPGIEHAEECGDLEDEAQVPQEPEDDIHAEVVDEVYDDVADEVHEVSEELTEEPEAHQYAEREENERVKVEDTVPVTHAGHLDGEVVAAEHNGHAEVAHEVGYDAEVHEEEEEVHDVSQEAAQEPKVPEYAEQEVHTQVEHLDGSALAPEEPKHDSRPELADEAMCDDVVDEVHKAEEGIHEVPEEPVKKPEVLEYAEHEENGVALKAERTTLHLQEEHLEAGAVAAEHDGHAEAAVPDDAIDSVHEYAGGVLEEPVEEPEILDYTEQEVVKVEAENITSPTHMEHLEGGAVPPEQPEDEGYAEATDEAVYGDEVHEEAGGVHDVSEELGQEPEVLDYAEQEVAYVEAEGTTHTTHAAQAPEEPEDDGLAEAADEAIYGDEVHKEAGGVHDVSEELAQEPEVLDYAEQEVANVEAEDTTRTTHAAQDPEDDGHAEAADEAVYSDEVHEEAGGVHDVSEGLAEEPGVLDYTKQEVANVEAEDTTRTTPVENLQAAQAPEEPEDDHVEASDELVCGDETHKEAKGVHEVFEELREGPEVLGDADQEENEVAGVKAEHTALLTHLEHLESEPLAPEEPEDAHAEVADDVVDEVHGEVEGVHELSEELADTTHPTQVDDSASHSTSVELSPVAHETGVTTELYSAPAPQMKPELVESEDPAGNDIEDIVNLLEPPSITRQSATNEPVAEIPDEA